MSPYVIDQKKRQEYFLFLIFFIVISFALGYFFGYQSGQGELDVGNNQSPTVKPLEKAEELKAVAADKGTIEKKNPTSKNKTAHNKKSDKKTERNKNSKETATRSVKNKPKPKQASTEKPKSKPKLIVKPKADSKPVKSTPVLKAAKETKKEIKKKSTDSRIVIPKTALDKKEEIKSKPEGMLSSASNTVIIEDKVNSLDSAIDSTTSVESSGPTENNNPVKTYSVQVGMFASRPNAEKFVNTLKSSGFDVYLGDFTSSSGVEKYNVRLGPYAERVQARDSMSLYKKSYSTPAYIIINK
jgi:cell division protein FtsN